MYLYIYIIFSPKPNTYYYFFLTIYEIHIDKKIPHNFFEIHIYM